MNAGKTGSAMRKQEQKNKMSRKGRRREGGERKEKGGREGRNARVGIGMFMTYVFICFAVAVYLFV